MIHISVIDDIMFMHVYHSITAVHVYCSTQCIDQSFLCLKYGSFWSPHPPCHSAVECNEMQQNVMKCKKKCNAKKCNEMQQNITQCNKV